jgi:double-stranded uracil-DNA glycosylase
MRGEDKLSTMRINVENQMKITSFAPVIGSRVKVIILGSMPGRASLEANEYYAHARNAFWPIIGAIAGFSPTAPYLHRLDALKQSGIALWDVLHSCKRPGSADSDIISGTRVANDFGRLFSDHPEIELVCFNGSEAERSFNRFVLSSLNLREIDYLRLPSTSPAYAALSHEKKLEIWRAAIESRLIRNA